MTCAQGIITKLHNIDYCELGVREFHCDTIVASWEQCRICRPAEKMMGTRQEWTRYLFLWLEIMRDASVVPGGNNLTVPASDASIRRALCRFLITLLK